MSNHSSPLSDVSPPSTTLGDSTEERNTAALELELEDEVMLAREDKDQEEGLPLAEKERHGVQILLEEVEAGTVRKVEDVPEVGGGPTSDEAVVSSTSPPVPDHEALESPHVDVGMDTISAASPEVPVPTLKRALPEEFDTILLSPSPPPASTIISTSPINLISRPPSPDLPLSTIFTQPTIQASVPFLPLPSSLPFSIPPSVPQAATLSPNPQNNPYEDPNSAAAKAAKSASEWNGLLKYARKGRGPQWDWGSGMYVLFSRFWRSN